MSQEVFDNDGDHLGPNEGISSSFPDIMAAVEKGWAEIPSAAEIFLDQSEVSEVPATFFKYERNQTSSAIGRVPTW